MSFVQLSDFFQQLRCLLWSKPEFLNVFAIITVILLIMISQLWLYSIGTKKSMCYKGTWQSENIRNKTLKTQRILQQITIFWYLKVGYF